MTHARRREGSRLEGKGLAGIGGGGAAALVLAALLLATPAAAKSKAMEETAREAGWQAASAFSTLLYGPAKLAFALCGGAVGGLTWLFSGGNDDAALAVWTPTTGGDYLLTPEHLQGKRRIAFVGPTRKAGPAKPDVATAPR